MRSRAAYFRQYDQRPIIRPRRVQPLAHDVPPRWLDLGRRLPLGAMIEVARIYEHGRTIAFRVHVMGVA